MLFVVKECVEIVLGIPPPSCLVLESDAFVVDLILIRQPDRDCADTLAMGELILEALLVFAGHPEAVDRRGRKAGVTIDGDGRRERIERRDTNGGGGGGCFRR